MAVTRSTAADRQAAPPLIRAAESANVRAHRRLLFASLLVIAALASHLQRENGRRWRTTSRSF